MSVASQAPAPAPVARIGGSPTRTVTAASRSALGALMLRDLVVLGKHIWEFVLRTLIQPFLLCFVFLYVFPKIGQGVGGGHGPVAESAFATILVPGVVGISVMFQGVQSIALAMAQEFGFTREIEDRVQAPCPIWLVAIAKVLSGAAQGVLSAIIVLPIASVVHAPGVHANLTLHWWLIVTFVPLACVAMAGLGLVLGTSFEPRNIGLMFGFIILPITFLGGTYYSWTKLAPVTVGGWHWLQTIVLVNPLIYVNEGMRAAFTSAPHMHLYVIYPVVAGFAVTFLAIGLRNFRRRVLSLCRERRRGVPRGAVGQSVPYQRSGCPVTRAMTAKSWSWCSSVRLCSSAVAATTRSTAPALRCCPIAVSSPWISQARA
jgi:ABC-2 type transport system permease protein